MAQLIDAPTPPLLEAATKETKIRQWNSLLHCYWIICISPYLFSAR
jgi:hypothetical protein